MRIYMMKFRYTALFCLLLLPSDVFAGSAFDRVRDNYLALIEKNQYEEALNIVMPYAESGDDEGQLAVGIGGQDDYSIDPAMLIARAYITRKRGKKLHY